MTVSRVYMLDSTALDLLAKVSHVSMMVQEYSNVVNDLNNYKTCNWKFQSKTGFYLNTEKV